MATKKRKDVSSVVVAMDGSGNAIRALKFAIDSGAKGKYLHIVHVQPRIKSSRLMPKSFIEEHYDRQEEAAFGPARALLKRESVTATFAECLGEPAPTLVSYAREHGCRQIVIGNRGHGTVANIFLGSVAMKVLHLAQVPVTLVK